jgi:small subunit ribosomal protein S2
MSIPEFTMRQLLEAGVHFGHHTRRWNPKMRDYIFGVRNGVHIIDLQQTTPLLRNALQTIRDIVANGGRVLFVGTKRQAQDKIKESAKRSGQYYVNHRWLGGMLTNWQTISKSINRLRELDTILEGELTGYTKKEILHLTRERDKLERSVGGIKDMGGLPNALFVIDTNLDDIAIKEANNLGIPVFAILDSNSSPEGVDFPIPGNDDSARALGLYCDLVTSAILDGLQAELGTTGKDPGASEKPEVDVPSEAEVTELAKKATKSSKKANASEAEDTKEKKNETSEENSSEQDGKKQATA